LRSVFCAFLESNGNSQKYSDTPITRDRSLGNPLANRITVPLLEWENRWLFLQLARELP
jgi:hypothetical protein